MKHISREEALQLVKDKKYPASILKYEDEEDRDAVNKNRIIEVLQEIKYALEEGNSISPVNNADILREICQKLTSLAEAIGNIPIADAIKNIPINKPAAYEHTIEYDGTYKIERIISRPIDTK